MRSQAIVVTLITGVEDGTAQEHRLEVCAGRVKTWDAFPTLCPTSLLSRETEPEAPVSVEIKGESLYWKRTLPDPFLHSASRIPAATVDFLGRGLEESSVKKMEWPQNKDT